MDIKKIKDIVNEPFFDNETKRALIIDVIADDHEAIKDVLEILDRERKKRRELVSDLSMALSKADAALDSPSINKDNFIQKEVQELYVKWKGFVNHAWKKYY